MLSPTCAERAERGKDFPKIATKKPVRIKDESIFTRGTTLVAPDTHIKHRSHGHYSNRYPLTVGNRPALRRRSRVGSTQLRLPACTLPARCWPPHVCTVPDRCVDFSPV